MGCGERGLEDISAMCGATGSWGREMASRDAVKGTRVWAGRRGCQCIGRWEETTRSLEVAPAKGPLPNLQLRLCKPHIQIPSPTEKPLPHLVEVRLCGVLEGVVGEAVDVVNHLVGVGSAAIACMGCSRVKHTRGLNQMRMSCMPESGVDLHDACMWRPHGQRFMRRHGRGQQEEAGQDSSTTVQKSGLLDNVHEWMAAVDTIIAKARPGTIAEALICGLPILLNGSAHLFMVSFTQPGG